MVESDLPDAHYKVLTRAHADSFVRDGYVIVRDVFSASTARALLPAVWSRLAERPDDPRTWQRMGVQVEEVIEEGPIGEMFTDRFKASVDDLVGAGRWSTRWGYGWIALRFPGFHAPPWTPPTTGWHADGIHFHHHLTSREQGLVGIEMLTDIAPGGGGTALRVGSHRLVSRALAAAEPAGLSYAELRALSEGIVGLPVEEATGRAGDVLWMHPHLVHARSPNVGKSIRIAANRCIALNEPMNLRRNSAELSLVERAILMSLNDRQFAVKY